MNGNSLSVIATIVFLGLAFSSFRDGNNYLAVGYLCIALLNVFYVMFSNNRRR